MERNEVSFSIPTWKKEEIRAINLAEEEALHMSSPYNLQDFKTELPSVPYIFTPHEGLSELPEYSTKRQLHPSVPHELALFVLALNQAILCDSQSEGTGQLVGALKQRIYMLDLCQLQDIPSALSSYYKNEILKKILFQYIGKCVYNISLIELLLLNNEMLRFAVVLAVKTVLQEQRLAKSYREAMEFAKMAAVFVEEFAIERQGKALRFEKGQLRSTHFLLQQEKDTTLSFYRKEVKINKTEGKAPVPPPLSVPSPKKPKQKPVERKDPTFKRPKLVTKRLTKKEESLFSCLASFCFG